MSNITPARILINFFKVIYEIEDVNIYVDWRSHNYMEKSMPGSIGMCTETRKKSSFVFTLHNNLKEKENILTLCEVIAHEMKHVQQIRNGRLRLGNRYYWWDGIKYDPKKIAYRKCHHEISAYSQNRKGAYIGYLLGLFSKPKLKKYFVIYKDEDVKKLKEKYKDEISQFRIKRRNKSGGTN